MRVERRDRLPSRIETIAGVDAADDPAQGELVGAAVALALPGLELEGSAVTRLRPAFPYVPGLLSFRELPVVLAALEGLEREPDVVLCDAHGLAHPRRFGLACHLGVVAGLPTIGVAKSLLAGSHEPLPAERGAWRPLLDGGEVIGAALRTRAGVRPVYVSIGHRVSLETAIELVLAATPRYRLPETTRLADSLARARSATRGPYRRSRSRPGR